LWLLAGVLAARELVVRAAGVVAVQVDLDRRQVFL
jgi:hypothetical protein